MEVTTKASRGERHNAILEGLKREYQEKRKLEARGLTGTEKKGRSQIQIYLGKDGENKKRCKLVYGGTQKEAKKKAEAMMRRHGDVEEE